MGWIALSDQTRQVFDLAGIGASAADDLRPVRHDLSPNSLLVRGSLMFEMRLPGDGRPRRLLGYHRDHPWISSLSVQELPTGGIALVITQGRDVFHTVLEHDAVTQAEELRVTYSWDAPARWGRLAIERIRSGRVFLKELHDPKPLLLNDLQVMTLDPLQRQMDRSVLFFAVSDAVEPIGPMPSLTAQVPVLTDRDIAPQRAFGVVTCCVRAAVNWCLCCTLFLAKCPALEVLRRFCCGPPILGCNAIWWSVRNNICAQLGRLWNIFLVDPTCVFPRLIWSMGCLPFGHVLGIRCGIINS